MTRRNRRIVAATIGAAGLVVSLVGGFFDPEAFFRAWLAGFAACVGLSLGALMLLMAHDLTGGAWGIAARPPLSAIAAMMPLAVVAFVPLLFGLSRLYPWANAATADGLANRFYLNPVFFLVRALIYFVLWLGVTALALRPAERHRDGTAIGRRSSAPGLIMLGLTVTFSAFDWTMSLDPHWSSSIYGLFVTASNLLAALAAATLALCVMRPVARERPASGHDPLSDLGSLLLAGIMLWSYLALMQLVIIWEANLADEITWYLHRVADGWQGVDWILAACGAALPFCILVGWPLKGRPGWLGAACVLLLGAYLLTQWWLVLPPHGIGWVAPAVFAGIGGIWLALFDLRLERGRLFGPAVAGAGALSGETHG